MGVMVSSTAQRCLTPITAWMSGVFPSSSSLAACTSAPCASASAIRGRLCRREDRWRRAPGWSSLGSSGSDGTSCSISTSPLEDSSDSSSAGRQVTVIWREKCQQDEEISRKCTVCYVIFYVVDVSGFGNKNVLKSIAKNTAEISSTLNKSKCELCISFSNNFISDWA